MATGERRTTTSLRTSMNGFGRVHTPGSVNYHMETHYVSAVPHATKVLARECRSSTPSDVVRHRPPSPAGRQNQRLLQSQLSTLPASIQQWEERRRSHKQTPPRRQTPQESQKQRPPPGGHYTTEHQRSYRPFPEGFGRGPGWQGHGGTGIPVEVWTATDFCFWKASMPMSGCRR